MKRPSFLAAGFAAVILVLAATDCSRTSVSSFGAGNRIPQGLSYPDFITANKDYYITRIGNIAQVKADTFHLQVTGLVSTPKSFTLRDLMSLPQIEIPLTISCIGNGQNGPLVSTAVWKGFRLYDLLVSLGLDSNATGVKYLCADGFYASHTMDQVKSNEVIGALFMNGDTLPPVQGFPLRILSPGYFGAKQPAWVVSIEVNNRPLSDYWGDRGWDVSPPIPVTSRIFFPAQDTTVAAGDTLLVGGAAYGGTRVAKVELTTDTGATWQQADIVQSMDADNVWVFWLARIVFSQAGTFVVNCRATDIHGASQPAIDTNFTDGTNSWPAFNVSVVN